VGGRGGRRLRWERDAEAVKEAELRDGKYWLVTTLDAPPEEILRIYCSRAAVERAFRITKESIRIRPMWSRKEEHILAHLFVCYLAYLLMALLEVQVRVEEPKLTAVRALQRFGRVTRRVGRRVDVSEDEALLERAFRDSG
jgi:transposase